MNKAQGYQQENGLIPMEKLFRREALQFPRYTLNEPAEMIRLHQNEVLTLDDEERLEFISELSRMMLVKGSEAFNTYPSLQPHGLLRAFADSLGVDETNVEVTSGSSQALTLLAEALFAPGRRVAVTSPSFSLYAHLARLYGSEVVDIELDHNFEFSAQSLFSEQVLQSQVAILCSPNNPTGTVLSYDMIVEFASVFQGVLIVDEAYFEFFEAQGGESCTQFATEQTNVIVLRTLSKAWAAAGLRVGALVGHHEVISLFRALKPPYSIAWPSEVLATFILNNKALETRKRIKKIVEQVRDLQCVLSSCSGIDLLPESKANFIFFKTRFADKLDHELNSCGFVVRRYTSGRLNQCVRISMPSEEHFQKLKESLMRILK
jgi:histidinol-phosphate aminotransferase